MTVAVAVLQEEMVSFVLELASTAGLGQVAENLGISEDDLELMLAGEAEWPQRALQVVEEANNVITLLVGDDRPAELAAVSTDETLADWRDTSQAKAADEVAARVAAEGLTHGENLANRAKSELYRYLEVIARRQFDVNLDESQSLSLLSYRLELELLIIMYYKETVPLPGMNWDAVRRMHEADERAGRLTMVRDNQRRAERFFTKVRRLMGRHDFSEGLVHSVAREAASMENPLETDDDIDFIIGRSQFGRILQGAR